MLSLGKALQISVLCCTASRNFETFWVSGQLCHEHRNFTGAGSFVDRQISGGWGSFVNEHRNVTGTGSFVGHNGGNDFCVPMTIGLSTRFSLSVENEQADAGRDGRTYLGRPNLRRER